MGVFVATRRKKLIFFCLTWDFYVDAHHRFQGQSRSSGRLGTEGGWGVGRGIS